jgi:hypothetical protein
MFLNLPTEKVRRRIIGQVMEGEEGTGRRRGEFIFPNKLGVPIKKSTAGGVGIVPLCKRD